VFRDGRQISTDATAPKRKISMTRSIASSMFQISLILGAVGTASASNIYNFAAATGSDGNSYGNSFSLTVGGITVTATGWVLANTNSNTKFATAAVDIYHGTNLGLGVCSSDDSGGAGCGSPNHQIDNANTSGLPGGDEFILFSFSQAVDLGSLQITNYSSINGSTAVGLTYYTAQTSLTTNTTLGSLGTGTTVNGNSGSGNPVTDVLIGSSVKFLLVGASVPDSGTRVDSFKLNSLTVSPSATPEPATFAMIAMSLSGMGLAAWRKRKSQSTAANL
jgi:hypothetical protein